MIGKAMARTARTLSGLGLTLGALFFAASLTPSLVPRTYLTQGVLAGTCFALGYGLGAGWRRLWAYLELPALPERWRRAGNAVAGAVCLAVAASFLWRAAGWQNSIRSAMAMPPVETAHPLKLCLVALATFAALLALARLFRLIAGLIAARLGRAIPPRLAKVLGLMVAAVLFWSLANGVLVRATFRVLDSSFREYDALIEPERPQPTAPGKAGSPASLVKWDELGRAGREFVATGPDAGQIGALTGRPAKEPIRVYVGLRAAETAAARAKLALEELKREGGFERSILIVITPTGTGWVDPAAMDSVEVLHDGDVASVALQYSYLSSPLSLLAQPEYGAEAAQALFAEIYGYWTSLPKDQRPRLYQHGLSLGAMNSERSAEIFTLIGDPIAGALWSGPPFESRIWRSVTDRRNAGTPQWLPQFRDGSIVRFLNQQGSPVPLNRPWGPMRIVYLQYASDPIVFFNYRDLYRRPDWLKQPRGPDVSPDLRWYPVVTMLQIALDMAVATTTPMGHGHVYAPEDYVDAWVAVTDVTGWTPEALAGLKQHFRTAFPRGDVKDDSARGG